MQVARLSHSRGIHWNMLKVLQILNLSDAYVRLGNFEEEKKGNGKEKAGVTK